MKRTAQCQPASEQREIVRRHPMDLDALYIGKIGWRARGVRRVIRSNVCFSRTVRCKPGENICCRVQLAVSVSRELRVAHAWINQEEANDTIGLLDRQSLRARSKPACGRSSRNLFTPSVSRAKARSS